MSTVQEPENLSRGLLRAREAVEALQKGDQWITPPMVRKFLIERDGEGCSQTHAIEACFEWRARLLARPIVQTVEKAFRTMDAVELDKAAQLLRAELQLRKLEQAAKERKRRQAEMPANPRKARRA